MKRVLYVEDDPINALVMVKLLEKAYTVVHVEDCESCLEALSREPFDLILMDINLGRGKVDGIETMKRIRSADILPAMPVVAVTSYAMPEDQARFLSQGFNGYVAKPVDRVALLTYLDRFFI